MMLIRRLQARELGELLALYAHLHSADDPLPSPPIVESVWQEMLSHPRLQCFGGRVDGALVASCTLTIIPNVTRGCRPYGVIENVVTHAGHRQQGHGRAMLAHALAHAWAEGCYKVMLMTGRTDDATLRFYESSGFDRHAKQAFISKPPH
ncbi:GNAT family N-acetyltransferase [Piscinibacter gummiphilus]|uniref:GNAT family N-acetyltransferase n=1 Tax=Piscinibacter gummiphilus TaxID=946333 RepID=A0ABZ0CSD3_9BURK|nr:GNAT family N-acetyltransferase [Piscinibacter gummiphilus]WOB07877.1 GNAT family N-acetyltransferase [Piscinibacter gummiphilus]